ncbi:XRE family transcriptional regulator [Leuconostoc citreum]|uniref:Putative regulatory protein n=1 Tax=Leuconostoc citreum TaxID=33964 RepID=Q8GC35_LEUCI|nr:MULTISPECIES: helix-turn-helix transcriptional regulator [Leuconostoc]KAA8380218.1 helix-turn-helix transcriptional regulator [Leuconostoc carnosum]MCT3075912.1 XRE family transcriptional regulator [Leuconostoc citreum]CAD38159.1 putative regulatory protein [Leuconostoc citreum]
MILNFIAHRIRQLRQQQNVSQEKFAYNIGMDRSYFASVESGKRNISIINLQKIVTGLGVTLEEFFKGI